MFTVFTAIQVGLLVAGLVIMSRGKYGIAGRVVTNPIASMVGIILAAQLPIALLISIILGLTEGSSDPPVVVPTRAGSAEAVQTVAAPRSASDHWWVDPLITCGALVMAAGLTAIAMQSAEENDVVYASLIPAETKRAQ
jgi:hypothetical protein